jgi:hypothetical protein
MPSALQNLRFCSAETLHLATDRVRPYRSTTSVRHSESRSSRCCLQTVPEQILPCDADKYTTYVRQVISKHGLTSRVDTSASSLESRSALRVYRGSREWAIVCQS